MNNRLCQRKPSSTRPVLTSVVTLVFLAMALSSCATQFPESPQKHRLFEELEKAPHPYYFVVERGVFSRILGIQPETRMRELLSTVKARWGEVGSLDTAGTLISYLRAKGLAPIADRIEETLSKNMQTRPPDLDRRLEAGAIKQGLVDAFYEVQRE